MVIEISDKLYEKIASYCNLNGKNDIVKEIEKYINIGFNTERFGSAPFTPNVIPHTMVSDIGENKDQVIHENEVVVEKTKESDNQNEVTNIPQKKPKIRIIKHD